MWRWKFTPRIGPTLAALVAIPLLVALGQWQLTRAAEKERSHVQFMQRRVEPAVILNARDPAAWELSQMLHRRIQVRGRYDAATHFLLDNQVRDGVAGYLVYTPLVLEGDENVRLLIDRGWVAGGPDRGVPPLIDTPPGVVALSGSAALPPAAGIKLGENLPENIAANVVRMQRIEFDQLARRYAGRLFPWELRLDPDIGDGFLREWHEPGSGHERNLGYAFQWFAMALVAALLYLYLNLQREDGRK